MSEKVECKVDGDLPKEFQEAGEKGLVQVHSCIGWIDLAPEEWSGGAATCVYRIKP